MTTDVCAAKLGQPDVSGMRVCGLPVVYLSAGERGNTYSGWYHKDRTDEDHHAVPKAWVR
jgi:hypothetical protein